MVTTVDLWLQVNSVPGEDNVFTTLPLSSATALFGRNGSGKSRLLETIYSTLGTGNRWLGRPTDGDSGEFSSFLIAPCGLDVDGWWVWVRDMLIWAYNNGDEGDPATIESDDLNGGFDLYDDTTWEQFAETVGELHRAAHGPSETLDLLLESPYLGLGFGYPTSLRLGLPGLMVVRSQYAPVLFEESIRTGSNGRLTTAMELASEGEPSMVISFDAWGHLISDQQDTAWALPPGTPHVIFASTNAVAGLDQRLTKRLLVSRNGRFTRTAWSRTDGEFVLNEDVVRKASELADAANRLAPAFVVDHGPISVEFDPNSPDAKVGIRLPSGFVPHGSLGSGVARWVAVAVDTALSRDRDTTARLFLIDEPEAHLHPSAIEDVGTWISDRRDAGDSVVVATHSAQILAHPALTNWVNVSRVDGRLTTRALEHTLSSVGDLAELAGFRQRDLLHLWRGVLLVEGLHDQQVLRYFFKRQLDSARLVTQPLRGSDNVSRVFEVELLEQLGLPIVVLLDDIRRAVLAGLETPATSEEKKAMRLLDAYQTSRLDRRLPSLHVLALPVPDIWCTLPDEAVHAAFPGSKFTSWASTLSAWRNIEGTLKGGFKGWFLKTFAIPTQSNQFVVAVLSHSRGLVPDEVLVEAVDDAIGFLRGQQDLDP